MNAKPIFITLCSDIACPAEATARITLVHNPTGEINRTLSVCDRHLRQIEEAHRTGDNETWGLRVEKRHS